MPDSFFDNKINSNLGDIDAANELSQSQAGAIKAEQAHKRNIEYINIFKDLVNVAAELDTASKVNKATEIANTRNQSIYENIIGANVTDQPGLVANEIKRNNEEISEYEKQLVKLNLNKKAINGLVTNYRNIRGRYLSKALSTTTKNLSDYRRVKIEKIMNKISARAYDNYGGDIYSDDSITALTIEAHALAGNDAAVGESIINSINSSVANSSIRGAISGGDLVMAKDMITDASSKGILSQNEVDKHKSAMTSLIKKHGSEDKVKYGKQISAISKLAQHPESFLNNYAALVNQGSPLATGEVGAIISRGLKGIIDASTSGHINTYTSTPFEESVRKFIRSKNIPMSDEDMIKVNTIFRGLTKYYNNVRKKDRGKHAKIFGIKSHILPNDERDFITESLIDSGKSGVFLGSDNLTSITPHGGLTTPETLALAIAQSKSSMSRTDKTLLNLQAANMVENNILDDKTTSYLRENPKNLQSVISTIGSLGNMDQGQLYDTMGLTKDQVEILYSGASRGMTESALLTKAAVLAQDDIRDKLSNLSDKKRIVTDTMRRKYLVNRLQEVADEEYGKANANVEAALPQTGLIKSFIDGLPAVGDWLASAANSFTGSTYSHKGTTFTESVESPIKAVSAIKGLDKEQTSTILADVRRAVSTPQSYAVLDDNSRNILEAPGTTIKLKQEGGSAQIVATNVGQSGDVIEVMLKSANGSDISLSIEDYINKYNEFPDNADPVERIKTCTDIAFDNTACNEFTVAKDTSAHLKMQAVQNNYDKDALPSEKVIKLIKGLNFIKGGDKHWGSQYTKGGDGDTSMKIGVALAVVESGLRDLSKDSQVTRAADALKEGNTSPIYGMGYWQVNGGRRFGMKNMSKEDRVDFARIYEGRDSNSAIDGEAIISDNFRVINKRFKSGNWKNYRRGMTNADMVALSALGYNGYNIFHQQGQDFIKNWFLDDGILTHKWSNTNRKTDSIRASASQNIGYAVKILAAMSDKPPVDDSGNITSPVIRKILKKRIKIKDDTIVSVDSLLAGDVAEILTHFYKLSKIPFEGYGYERPKTDSWLNQPLTSLKGKK